MTVKDRIYLLISLSSVKTDLRKRSSLRSVSSIPHRSTFYHGLCCTRTTSSWEWQLTMELIPNGTLKISWSSPLIMISRPTVRSKSFKDRTLVCSWSLMSNLKGRRKFGPSKEKLQKPNLKSSKSALLIWTRKNQSIGVNSKGKKTTLNFKRCWVWWFRLAFQPLKLERSIKLMKQRPFR